MGCVMAEGMTEEGVAEKLLRTTYVVDVYQDGELYSSGSAYCFHEQGFLATAGHVITNRTPIREEDWKDPGLKVLARIAGGKEAAYEVAMCGMNLAWEGVLVRSLQVDLAVLRPSEPRSGVEHLGWHTTRRPVGTRVLMAGFPDEMEPPLRFTEAVDPGNPGFRDSAEETAEKIRKVGQIPMVKSGMVGYSDSVKVDLDGSGSRVFDVGVYYVDNAMHSGASGGPVVDLSGKALGTITHRAVTKVPFPELEEPNKDVPSGSALAVATYTLVDAINNWSTPSG